jgi:hypothetical protein
LALKGLERKLVTSWLLLLVLPVLALALVLGAPGLWAKSGKWILPSLLAVSVVLVLSAMFFVIVIAFRMSARALKRKRP